MECKVNFRIITLLFKLIVPLMIKYLGKIKHQLKIVNDDAWFKII